MILFFLQRLIVKHAMAVTFEFRVFYLFSELLAHTFVFFRSLKSARTISSRPIKAFLYAVHYFLIFIECNFHNYVTPLCVQYSFQAAVENSPMFITKAACKYGYIITDIYRLRNYFMFPVSNHRKQDYL